MKKDLIHREYSLTEIHFQVISKLKREIRITKKYWKIIINVKHPSVKGKEVKVKECLRNPDFIRRSKVDKSVYLFYKKQNKYFLCVVAKHLNEKEGFIVTVYLTHKIIEGELIWPTEKKQIK